MLHIYLNIENNFACLCPIYLNATMTSFCHEYGQTTVDIYYKSLTCIVSFAFI